MHLSKTAYMADFVVYPVIIAALVFEEIDSKAPGHGMSATVAFVCGAIAWTVFEYLMHRFIFHGGSRIAALHQLHHLAPREYIGTPTWLSVTFFGAAIFFPSSVVFSVEAAAGLTAGFMTGFLWYGILHHVIHRRPSKIFTPILAAFAQRHHRHHARKGHGNFGVTTIFWDRVFGTEIVDNKGSGTEISVDREHPCITKRG